MDIAEALSRRPDFEEGFNKIKSRVKPEVTPGWYPYSTLSSLDHLDTLLHGENRMILRVLRNEPVLDLGAGDGTLAFFLESLGGVSTR